MGADSLGGPPLDSAGVALDATGPPLDSLSGEVAGAVGSTGPPDDSDEESGNPNNEAYAESGDSSSGTPTESGDSNGGAPIEGGGSNDGDVSPAPMLNYRHSLANDSIPEAEAPLEGSEGDGNNIEAPENGEGSESSSEEDLTNSTESSESTTEGGSESGSVKEGEEGSSSETDSESSAEVGSESTTGEGSESSTENASETTAEGAESSAEEEEEEEEPIDFREEFEKNPDQFRLDLVKLDAVADSLGMTSDSLRMMIDSLGVPLLDSLDIPLESLYSVTRIRSRFSDEELEEQIMDTVEVVRYDTTWYYIAKFLFSLRVEDDYREFRESPVSTDFFAHNYINNSKNKDAFHDKIADFTAKIVINELPKHPYMPGIFAGVDLDYRYNHQRFWSDTALSAVADTNTMHLTRKYSSLYLTAGLFNVDTNARLTYDINMRLCLLGEHIGNFTIGGYLRQDLSEDKTSYVRVDASYALEDVNIYWKYYSGNHDYWFNKDFDMEKKLKVEAKYVNDKWRLETGVGLTNRGGYVWMDSTFNIRQESKPFSTYTLWAKEHFRVWDGRINFIESIYFQKSSREKLLSLPIVSIYSSTYVDLVTKNKALRVQIGVDLRYDSKFYADNYRPSTMTFYNQRIEKQGNLLTATAFLNARISRCILFAKYEHFDYYLRNGGNYFSAYAYPIDPPLFRWGLRWSFFN